MIAGVIQYIYSLFSATEVVATPQQPLKEYEIVKPERCEQETQTETAHERPFRKPKSVKRNLPVEFVRKSNKRR